MSKEYINRELLENALEDENKNGNFVFAANWIMEIVDNLPTADVVPKSDVKELKGELAIAERHEKNARALFKGAVIQLQNARQEVAREIFESIEECIYLYYNKNDYTMPNIEEDIAELKKKYFPEEAEEIK